MQSCFGCNSGRVRSAMKLQFGLLRNNPQYQAGENKRERFQSKMEFTVLQLVIASLLLSGLCGVESHRLCSEYSTEELISEDEKSFSFPQDFTDKFPLTIFFSDPVSNITSPFIQGKMLTCHEWLLEMPTFHARNNRPPIQPVSFRAFHNATDVRILLIEAEGRTLCESLEVVRDQCGLAGSLDLSPEKILHRKAHWSSGRNFQITIPSKPTFVGYVVDVFFTKPITNIDVAGSSIKVVEFSPTHWTFLASWTQTSCIKLVDIFFTISYKDISDVEAMLLNGYSVYPINGQGKKSLAIFENLNLRNATKIDCNIFFVKRGFPWFGDITGRSLRFEAQVNPKYRVGLVIDIIFEDRIKELKVWSLRSVEIKGNHWRVHNAGWPMSANGDVQFDLLVQYFDHYYVKPVGIKINNEVVCGLATEPEFLLHNVPNTGASITEKKIYVEISISVVLVVVSIVVSVTIFGFLLVKKLKTTFKARQHIYNSAEGEPQAQSDDTYLSVLSNSVANDDTCSVRM